MEFVETPEQVSSGPDGEPDMVQCSCITGVGNCSDSYPSDGRYERTQDGITSGPHNIEHSGSPDAI